MTDPLSVTAGVLAVVTAGIAIAKGLHQIADTMGSAGQEVRWYANDIRLLTTVLEGIGDQLNKKAKDSWSKAERVLRDILDICSNVLTPMNDIQNSLVSLLQQYKHSNKKLRQVSARVWWFFKYKDKMLSYRQSLQNLNITLNTQLAAMKLNTDDKFSINISIQQSSLQLCIAEAERLLNDRTQLQLGANEVPSRRAIAGVETSKRPSISPADPGSQAQVNGITGLDVTDLDDEVDTEIQNPNNDRTEDMSRALILFPGREDELDDDADGLGTEEIVEVERKIFGTLDQTSDGSIQEIWEDLGSAMRKVIRYAQEMDYASTQAPRQTHPESPIRSPPIHVGDVRVTPSNDVPVQVTGTELVPAVGSAVNDQHVIFKNIDNKSYLFPYEAVRLWPDAKEAWLSLKFPTLNVAYEKMKRWGELNEGGNLYPVGRIPIQHIFDRGLFVLQGPEGHLIVPRYWSTLVQPGWTIELHIDDPIEWEGKPGISMFGGIKSIKDDDRGSRKLSRLFKRDYW